MDPAGFAQISEKRAVPRQLAVYSDRPARTRRPKGATGRETDTLLDVRRVASLVRCASPLRFVAMMEAAGYARLAEHRGEHDGFMARLSVIRSECGANRREIVPELIATLEDWFKRHDATWDREAAAAIGLG